VGCVSARLEGAVRNKGGVGGEGEVVDGRSGCRWC
jgi:hypothetical protein